jgi:hypothetical protein
LIIDGSEENIAAIRCDPLYGRYELNAIARFITRENINALIRDNLGTGEIGLLSVDIDGNDYWVWEAISAVDPSIVVCEYNSVFGHRHALTIPYDPQFQRTLAHYSNLYFGASLPALCALAERKGYDFVGSNSAGCNAFFVRRDLSQPFKKLDAATGYVRSRFRESRDRAGYNTFLGGSERGRLIRHLPVYDLTTDSVRPLGEFLEE